MRIGGIRSALAAEVLMILYVVAPTFLPNLVYAQPFREEGKEILRHMLWKYPDSVLFLWSAGRLARLEGDHALAMELFGRAVAGHLDVPRQVGHLCAYEMGLCECFAFHWQAALGHFALLEAENSWSRAFYAYVRAVCLLALGSVDDALERLEGVPALIERKIGGKLISAEQFVIRRAEEAMAAALVAVRDARHASPSTASAERIRGMLFTSFLTEDDVLRLSRPLGGAGEDGSAATAASSAEKDEGSPADRLSPAIRGTLAMPALEMGYLFNGFSQVRPAAVWEAIDLVDGFLAHLAGRDDWTPPKRPSADDAGGADAKATGAETGPEAEAEAAAALALLDEALRGGRPASASSSSEDAIFRAHPQRFDDVAVAALVRGAALVTAGRPAAARACFHWVAAREHRCLRDRYVGPHALYELSTLLPPGEAAAALLTRAKEFSHDYNFKVRLHLRVHLMLDAIANATTAT